MPINYPNWYKVEKETFRIISRLTSVKELSFYLRSPELFIRRLAILRMGELQLKEGLVYLTDILENHSEDQTNRELAAWAIKVTSMKWNEDIYITNRLLTHFTGNETIEDLLGSSEVKTPSYAPELNFNVPPSNSMDIIKNYVEFNNDFIIEDTFSGKEWFDACYKTSKERFYDSYKLVLSSPGKLFSDVYTFFASKVKTFGTNANKIGSKIKIQKTKPKAVKSKHQNPLTSFPHISTNFIHSLQPKLLQIGRNSLWVIGMPFRFARTHKILTSFSMLMLFMFAINIPWISKPLEQHTNIKPNEINQIIYGLGNQFLTMVSEGAADLLNSGKETQEVSKPQTKSSSQANLKVYIVTSKSGLSLRAKPSATSARIGSLMDYQTKVIYMNQEQKDQNGSIWYMVKTPDGKVGWASSKWLK